MKTDWNLIRTMMAAAIDACERIEAAGYTEDDRDVTIDVRGHQVSVQEFLQRVDFSGKRSVSDYS